MNKIKYKGKTLLPPKSDVVFKAIFGAPENKDILAALLRDFLDLDIENSEDLELINTELIEGYDGDKLSRLDIRIKIKDGAHIDVEIQVKDEGDIISRSLYYESLLFSSQMIKNMKYSQLSQAITLVILNFNLLKDEKDWYNTYTLANTTSHAELTDLFKISYVELEKFKEIKDMASLGAKEKWALFLSTESEEVLDMLKTQSAELDKAVEKLVYVSAEEKTRYFYDMKRKAEIDEYSRVTSAEDRGLERGIEQKAMEDARNFKAEGVSDDIISRATGLPLETVKSLIINL